MVSRSLKRQSKELYVIFDYASNIVAKLRHALRIQKHDCGNILQTLTPETAKYVVPTDTRGLHAIILIHHNTI